MQVFRVEVRDLWGGWALVGRLRTSCAAQAMVDVLAVQGILARIVND